MNFLGNAAVYVVLYVLFMLPTYLLPYVGSNSAVVGSLALASDAGVHPAFVAHAGLLLALIALTWVRGRRVEKAWLIVFPVLAMVFDLAPALNNIPLVPTVMHLLAIILGVVGSRVVVENRASTGSGV